jgi:hypothetical protein
MERLGTSQLSVNDSEATLARHAPSILIEDSEPSLTIEVDVSLRVDEEVHAHAERVCGGGEGGLAAENKQIRTDPRRPAAAKEYRR